MRTTPNNITDLADDEIFVFGSNILGEHAGGAAKLAWYKFGAMWGEKEGLTGQSYAFPTLDENFKPLSVERMKQAVVKLYETARDYPHKTFLLTKVGCGIAGMSEETMKRLFEGERPDNIVFPVGW